MPRVGHAVADGSSGTLRAAVSGSAPEFLWINAAIAPSADVGEIQPVLQLNDDADPAHYSDASPGIPITDTADVVVNAAHAGALTALAHGFDSKTVVQGEHAEGGHSGGVFAGTWASAAPITSVSLVLDSTDATKHWPTGTQLDVYKP